MKRLIFLILVLSSITLQATHNRAGEIRYIRIAPFSQNGNAVYTYSITLIRYTDDGPGIADRCFDTIYFGDGQKAIALRQNGPTGSCGCGTVNASAVGCGSLMINLPAYRLKYNEYSVIHTYPGPGVYVISSVDLNRNQGVHNISNSVNVPFYVEAMMVISPTLGSNSSPVLNAIPVDQATLGVCFIHNPGATDADGDSLSYELTTCRGWGGTTAPGYFNPECGYNGTYSIDVIGSLSWCSPQYLGEYNLAFIVKEYRKNTSGMYQLIGYVERDMQVLVNYGMVGIKENQDVKQIQVFPNPFSSKVQVMLDQSLIKDLFVVSMDGKRSQVRYSKLNDGRIELDLSTFVPGVYTLNAGTEHGVLRCKIVKSE